MVTCAQTVAYASQCKGLGGGDEATPPPLDFKLMLLCVQAVTTKRLLKFIIIEKQERKNSLQQCYTHKNQSLEVSKFTLVTCSKLNPRG